MYLASDPSIVYRNMVRKHCYNFRYSANMLKVRSRGFDRAHVLLDIWWNMLIKFSKQIANSFAKIINGCKRMFEILSSI